MGKIGKHPNCFDGKSWERYTYSGLNPDCFDGKDREIYIYSGLNPDKMMGKIRKRIFTVRTES